MFFDGTNIFYNTVKIYVSREPFSQAIELYIFLFLNKKDFLIRKEIYEVVTKIKDTEDEWLFIKLIKRYLIKDNAYISEDSFRVRAFYINNIASYIVP